MRVFGGGGWVNLHVLANHFKNAAKFYGLAIGRGWFIGVVRFNNRDWSREYSRR